MQDKELQDIKAHHAANFALDAEAFIGIVLKEGVWTVHDWRPDSVSPPTGYPTKARAAARVLQLLQLGPTAPQDYPETIEITKASKE
jgi:hypothetical protein